MERRRKCEWEREGDGRARNSGRILTEMWEWRCVDLGAEISRDLKLITQTDTPGFYVVCEYYPPGNVVGNKNQFFKDNVLKQDKGKETDTVESGVTSAARRDGVWMAGVLGYAVVLGAGMAL